MNTIDKRFLDAAEAQLAAEERAKRQAIIRDRARVLAERARQLATSDLRDPLTRLAELESRHKALLAEKKRRHPGCLSAADDHELDRLPARISELTKACRMHRLLPRTAA